MVDIDEFQMAIQLGVITLDQISQALKSFHLALTELNNPSYWPIPLIERAESIRREMMNNYVARA